MIGAFTYANPPAIRWGPGSRQALHDELGRLGAGRIAVVTTRAVRANGSLGLLVEQALGDAASAPVVIIGQHAPVADVAQAVDQLAPVRPDALVSIGGGSPIDAAKVIGSELGRLGPDGRRVLHVALPTTLSAAELSAGAGVTDEAGNKVGRRDDGMLPDSVIYDGELALHTPLPLWLSTGIRALDHAVEGFLSEGDHPFSDTLAVDAIRRLFDSLPRARSAPADAAVRTENQLAAWFSFTLPGPTAGGLGHMLGKQIGARHGIPHGVTSCLLLPHVIRYRARRESGRIGSLARRTGLGSDAEEMARCIEDLLARLELPSHLRAFGLNDEDISRAAEGLSDRHPAAELAAVYRAAW